MQDDDKVLKAHQDRADALAATQMQITLPPPSPGMQVTVKPFSGTKIIVQGHGTDIVTGDMFRAPTNQECDARETVEINGKQYHALWWPQMNGSNGKAWLDTNMGNGSFDIHLWHNGLRMLANKEQPVVYHFSDVDEIFELGTFIRERGGPAMAPGDV